MTAQEGETCVCAAIRLKGGRVFYGHRHHDCIRTAAIVLNHQKAGAWEREREAGVEQGFVTTKKRFVGREEGLRLQLEAGIESKAKGGYRGALFSEDLY